MAPVLVCLDINHFVHVARPWSLVEAPTANLIAKAAKSMNAFDLVSKERVDTLRPACPAAAGGELFYIH